jgi:hypothetical protein
MQTELAELLKLKHPNLLKVLGVAKDVRSTSMQPLVMSEYCDFSLEVAVRGNTLGIDARFEPLQMRSHLSR